MAEKYQKRKDPDISSLLSIFKKFHAIIFFTSLFIFFSAAMSLTAHAGSREPYAALPGLIDNRSQFSDGAHSIEELVRLAHSRGFKVLSINDHDRIAIAYGIPPFRNILSYKKEFPSILTHGAREYLREIDRVSKMYPDMIIIPGCETSAYYYWTGSYFNDDLTAHDYDKRVIILNFNDPDDYHNIPNLHNKLSLKYTERFLPLALIFLSLLFIGLFLMTWKGLPRIAGLILVAVSILMIADYNPFRSSMFTQYDGDKGIAPYQELINYVNKREGFVFWNYPEQKSGVRKYGPIKVHTPPYPHVLEQSRDYTGFAAVYGAFTKATKPGREWDSVLNEYCRGERERPSWGISAADFHEDGRLGLKLGSFPTIFLVKGFSKKAVLEAMERGRMYCSRSDGESWLRLHCFTVSGGDGKPFYMGETLVTKQPPLIRFEISHKTEKPVTVFLIRGGEIIHRIKEKTPIQAEYLDKDAPEGRKTYYRIMDSSEHLVSNPIFVTYNKDSS
ncbi:MAG: hypothetical protein JW882_20165 [Deltaproteobacteria bacterium]|nr:hypothetical protein [Deltaproteobacteria bacterium]